MEGRLSPTGRLIHLASTHQELPDRLRMETSRVTPVHMPADYSGIEKAVLDQFMESKQKEIYNMILGEGVAVFNGVKVPPLNMCEKCGYIKGPTEERLNLPCFCEDTKQERKSQQAKAIKAKAKREKKKRRKKK